jgi:hypothetical protein
MLKVGDKVKLMERYENCPWGVGSIGTVVLIGKEAMRYVRDIDVVGVMFDDPRGGGHDLKGNLPFNLRKNGYFISVYYLELDSHRKKVNLSVGDKVQIMENYPNTSPFSVYRATCIGPRHIEILSDRYELIFIDKIFMKKGE